MPIVVTKGPTFEISGDSLIELRQMFIITTLEKDKLQMQLRWPPINKLLSSFKALFQVYRKDIEKG